MLITESFCCTSEMLEIKKTSRKYRQKLNNNKNKTMPTYHLTVVRTSG